MSVETMTPETGVDESISQLTALLGSEESDNQSTEKQEAQVTEEDGESDEPESSESEQDEDEGTEYEEDDEQPEDATLEDFEVDGKQYKIPSDLKPYILRQQDYTRKTQEVAELRKATEAIRASAEQAGTQYMQGLQVLQQAYQAALPQPPNQALLDDDPLEYMRQERHYNAAVQRLNAVQAEQQRAAQLMQSQEQALRQQALREAVKQLPDLIPEWRDKARAKKEIPQLAEYLKGNGFSDEEVNLGTDPRAFKLARKAWLFDQMMAQKKATRPVASKSAPAGPARNPSSNTSAVSKARQALKRSNGRDDAAAAFLIGQFLKE